MKIRCMHFFLLTIVFNAMSMERTIYIPKNAQDIIEQSQSPDVCKYWELEKKWYGLMCATWYGNEKAVENLLKNRALDHDTLYGDCLELQTNHLLTHRAETFPRISVSHLALNAYKKNKKIMDLYQADNSLHNMRPRVSYQEITKETKEKLITTMCPLYALAVYLGDLELLQDCMINENFNSDYCDVKGGSLLQLAVRGNHEDIVTYLLQFPCIQKNINRSAGLAPALFIAAQRGYLSIAHLLLEVPDIDVEARYYKHNYTFSTSALEIATREKHVEMVKLLGEQLLRKNKDKGCLITKSLSVAFKKKNNPTLKELLNMQEMDQSLKNQCRKVALNMVKDEIKNKIKTTISLDNNLMTLISFLRENDNNENIQPIMINLNELLNFK